MAASSFVPPARQLIDCEHDDSGHTARTDGTWSAKYGSMNTRRNELCACAQYDVYTSNETKKKQRNNTRNKEINTYVLFSCVSERKKNSKKTEVKVQTQSYISYVRNPRPSPQRRCVFVPLRETASPLSERPAERGWTQRITEEQVVFSKAAGKPGVEHREGGGGERKGKERGGAVWGGGVWRSRLSASMIDWR